MERLERPLGPLLGPAWDFLTSFSDRLGPCWAHLGVPLGPNYQFSSSFSTFLAGRCWACVCGHPWGPLGAILSLLGRFLGPPRGHLWPCWALFGASLGVLGARLEPSWARYGPDRAPLGSSLGFFGASCAILRSLGSSLGVIGACLVASWARLGSPGSPAGLLGAILKPIGGSAIRSIFPMRGSGEI